MTPREMVLGAATVLMISVSTSCASSQVVLVGPARPAVSAGAVGAGISTETNSARSPYGLGFGVSVFFQQKAGDGVAIFVEPR